MRRAFGKAIVKLAEKDPNVILLTGDVEQDITEYKDKFPDRYFNLGLCEQTIVSMAAGMALEGLRPVVYSITPFLIERPFEQIKIDIDEQNLPVILIGYSAYPSHGPTHRPLNAEGLVGLFKNVAGYFPHTMQEAEADILDAYVSRRPSIICLKRDGIPFF
jgi:transketolase